MLVEAARAVRRPVSDHGAMAGPPSPALPPEQPDDGPDRRPEPALSDLHLQVPDDARELAADLRALQRERRQAARRRRLARLLLTRRWRRFGLSGPLLVAVLLVVALYGLLLTALHPRGPVTPAARPLASPDLPPGAVGGLLPDVRLQLHLGSVLARQTGRPEVLALVPPDCGCVATLRDVIDQAISFTRNLRLIGDGRSAGARSEVEQLRTTATQGLARTAVDPSGALFSAYDAQGVTLLLVGADGVVLDVLRDVGPHQRLEARLERLS